MASLAACAGHRSKLINSGDWCLPPSRPPQHGDINGVQNNIPSEQQKIPNEQQKSTWSRLSPRQLSARSRKKQEDGERLVQMLANSISNMEARERMIVEQVRRLEEQILGIEGWKSVMQEDFNQLSQQQRPQPGIGKPQDEKLSAITPQGDKQLETPHNQQQPTSARSVERAGLSNETLLTNEMIAVRLENLEMFERSFSAHLEDHRRLKEHMAHLNKTEVFIALQRQLDSQLASQNDMKSQIKEIVTDKISPFAEPEAIQVASVMSSGGKTKTSLERKEEKGEDEAEFEREMEDTVWDAMIFVFTRPIGCVNSVFMIAAFLMAICIQFIFILIVQTNSFTGSMLPTLDDTKNWRHTVAHDHRNINPLAKTSLATMICQQDGSLILATSQAMFLDAIISYLEPLPVIDDMLGVSGHLLCLMSVLVWSMVLARETWCGCIQLLIAVCNVHSNPIETKIEIDEKSGKYVLRSMSVTRKTIVITILCARCCLCVTLFHAGILWLAYDLNVPSLLLNCTALGLVLDIGAQTYGILTPHHSKVMLHRFKGLPLPKHLGVTGILPPAIFLALIQGAMLATNFSILKDQTQLMRDIQSAMCDGNQEFVFFAEPVSHYYLTTASKKFGSAPSSTVSHYSHLTAEIVGVTNASLITGVFPYQTWIGFESAVDAGFTAFVESKLCNDFPHLGKVNSRSLTVRAAYEPNVDKCSDLEQYCHLTETGSLARLTCPETCGCNHVFSGLVPKSGTYGCPMISCESSIRFQLTALPCVDKNLSDLKAMPGWATYFKELPHFSQPMSDAHVRNAIYAVRDGGCSTIPDIKNTTVDGIEMMNTLCKGTDDISGISTFCPLACECKATMIGCPKTCPI